MESTTLPNIAVLLKHSFNKYGDALNSVIPPSQRKVVDAFVQAPQYAPQSGEIFGILRNMKDTFESNLANSQKEEMENQKAYEDLKAAKEQEIKSG